MESKLDITISGSRLWLRTLHDDTPAQSDDAEGEDNTDTDEIVIPDIGPGNLAQGLRFEPDLVMIDALYDELFGADVIVRHAARFSADKRAQRRVKLPFSLAEGAGLVVGSPEEELAVPLAIPAGDYTLYIEICVGRDVFYVLTLTPESCTSAIALLRDGWGLKKDQVLLPGVF